MRSSQSRKSSRRPVPRLVGLERRDVPAVISGFKYEDLNADNIRQAGEPGLSGFVIELQDLVTKATTQATTDVTGAYKFSGLKPGTYRLLDLPDPSRPEFIPSSTDIVIRQVLSVGDVIGNVNFGAYRLAGVGGSVFEDVTADGKNGGGDRPIVGAKVFLDQNGNGVFDPTEPFALTGFGGAFSIDGLVPGKYRVTLESRTGEVPTTPGAVDVTLISNERRGDVSFGSYILAGVSGTVFNDADGNGQRESAEPPLAGVTVYVDVNNNGQFDPGEPSGKTADDGSYTLTGLGPAPVIVRLNLSPALLQTSGPAGAITLQSSQLLTGQDFGVLRAGRISGELFDDINGDGVRDDDEPGLVGFGFELYDSALDRVATTVTDLTGRFTFLNLPGGVYLVRQIPDDEYTPTTPEPDFFSLGETNQIDDLLFGNFRLVTISGFVFNDRTGDGRRGKTETDPGDPGAFGFDLQLVNLTTGVNRITATDLAGNYRFGETGPGIYRIQLLPREGWQATTTTFADVTVGPPETILKGYDFGAFEFAKISGFVFEDRNRSGDRDPDDLPLDGFVVYIDVNQNGVRDPDDPFTVSAKDGGYEFGQLAPGIYRPRVVVPAGFVATTTPPFEQVLFSGERAEVDFGNARVAQITGTVFDDRNGDGVFQPGEPSLVGWNVRLTDAITGAVVSTVASRDDGGFTFEGISPGSYRVRAVPRTGWLQTTTDPADFVLGTTSLTDVAAFGQFQLATIGGRVFEDANGNGVFDPADRPLAGVAVFIDANNNGAADAGERLVLTDDFGRFRFADLGPGAYRIRQVPSSGATLTSPLPPVVVPVSGQVVEDLAFANFTPASVAGTVFLDRNGNGVRDANEPGLAGVELALVPVGEVVPAVVFPAVTDANGNFTITDLRAGSYRLTQSPLPGFTPTLPAGGYLLNLVSGERLAGLNFANEGRSLIVTGRDAGDRPEVALYTADGGQLTRSFLAYDAAFRGGVRVAQGRAIGGGAFVVTAPGPGGGPDVRIFDAATGLLRRGFFAYDERFTGGVHVAAGDVNGDGVDDIITGADAGGGPHVRVFDGATGAAILELFPYVEDFRGGVRVAAGDADGDGRAEIVTAAGPGGGPHVRIFNAAGGLVSEFFAYAVGFTGGVFVSAGDSTGDGRAEVFTGAGEGGGPNVRVFDALRGKVIRDLFSFAVTFRGGVRVSAADVNFDGRVDLVTAPGAGTASTVRTFDGETGRELTSFGAFDPSFLGGVFVG